MTKDAISRQHFVKAVGVGAATLLAGVPAFIPHRAEAANALKIGQIEELTGVYSDVAISEARGAQLALEAWNARGGVMGRKVEIIVEDTQNQPGVTVEKVRKLINGDKVAAIFGTVNSADSLAACSTANALSVLYLDSGGHVDALTDTQCHWNCFRTCHSGWMETHATGYSIAKLFGKRWYLITPDFAYGHSLARGYAAVLKQLGGTIVGNDLTPIGTPDFSPYIAKTARLKPDVIINLQGGQDFVNYVKQAKTYGLLEEFPIAGPQGELEPFLALPPEDRVGYWGVEWYYNSDLVFNKTNKAAVDFVAAYRKRYHLPPSSRSCFGYVTLDRLLWAMNEARSVDPVKVARRLEGAEFTSLWEGSNSYRSVDHQLIWPMWFAKARPHGTPQDPFDIFEIIDREPGEKIAKSAAEKAQVCHLNYPS